MSIESAREKVEQYPSREWDHDCAWHAEWLLELDRLIDEVRAAMPCYGEYTGTDCPPADLRPFLGRPRHFVRCPSCEARARLAAKEAPVVAAEFGEGRIDGRGWGYVVEAAKEAG